MTQAEHASGGWVASPVFAEPQGGCIIPNPSPERSRALAEKIAKGWYMDQKPSVGRIVHYVSYGTPGGEYSSTCRAAIVAGVPEGALPPIGDSERAEAWDSDAVVADLVVMNPTGLFFNRCPQSEDDHKGGTWHWPERV